MIDVEFEVLIKRLFTHPILAIGNPPDTKSPTLNSIFSVINPGVTDSMQYTPGINQKLIAENAMLNVCEEKCEVESVSAKIHLETAHIGKGCDRDTYSIESQRKLCGLYIILCLKPVSLEIR